VRAERTYYEVLGVSPTVSALQLKTAYRRLLRQAHPDMGGSAALLDLVNEAYDTLKDPSRRARYDAAIRQGAKTTASGSAEPPPPPPRTPPPRGGSSSPNPAPGTPFARPTSHRRTAGEARQNGFGSRPPDDVPRSPSGRVPQWVIDEAQGRAPQHAVPWRAYPSGQTEQSRDHGRRRWARGLTSALTILAFVGAALWLQSTGMMPGFANALASRPANWPKAGVGESDHPLGVPAPLVATASDSYSFMAHQADGTTPVAYDPCRPIHYVIRAQGQPLGGAKIITDALLRVSGATGLRFVYDGSTSEAPSRQRSPYQPERYGDRWAPVLISWTTPSENPDFAADVLGQAGSTPVGLPYQSRAYVTGEVELDPGRLATIRQWPNGNGVVRAVVLHELGHLVGLDHVTSAGQLMYPKSQPGVTDFGEGDLTGLAALGTGTCLPDL